MIFALLRLLRKLRRALLRLELDAMSLTRRRVTPTLLMVIKSKVVLGFPRFVFCRMEYLSSIMLFEPRFQIFRNSVIKSVGSDRLCNI
jgi:hypothetical protein